MTLRPYQQRIVDAVITQLRTSLDPVVVEAATGAGKSHVIAAVAAEIHATTQKRVLCLAPSAELVIQNREKYLATGNPASTYSASAGAKSLRHSVVFGSPLTVVKNLPAFCCTDRDGYALVIVDEAHGITPTLRKIIRTMRVANPNLRVLGFTATPYRLGTGYIYREGAGGEINGDDVAREPYFDRCVVSVRARELIEGGFLTPPLIGQINADRYDTESLTLNSRHQFDASAIDRAYHGQGRKTAAIVADVVAQSADRRGVLIFAATVQHAREVLASLPPELSAVVTGETSRSDRENILRAFKALRIKYVVNVGVLTTGFDAPHVDVIAILRKTESVGLLQQIAGRGSRLYPGKHSFLLLDYTTNLAEHCPDGDLFAPVVRAKKPSGASGEVTAVCPECEYANDFAARPDAAGYTIDRAGYCLDLDGNRVCNDHGPLPAHFGRRCAGYVRIAGDYQRCGYRWTYKSCHTCAADNDIAARYCSECKSEIVDPNDKLSRDFRALKSDPTQKQVDRVLSWSVTPTVSRAGNKTVRVMFTTPHRSFTAWFLPEARHTRGAEDWRRFRDATAGGCRAPETVTYKKDAKSGFYAVLAYNEPAQELELLA